MGWENPTVEDRTEPISSAIVREVADRESVDPLELEPPLHTVVDTDALNDLFETNRQSDLTIVFQYAGYEITVEEPNQIDIRELE